MKKILLTLLLLAEIYPLYGIDPIFNKEEKRNIDHFSVAAYPVPVSGTDSIRIMAYLDLPYVALQFVKKDSTFRADFQGTITLRDKEGNQYGRKIWKDSVVVDNYVSTISMSLSVISHTSFLVPPGKYDLVAQVMDMDTKNSGEDKGEWDLTQFNEPNAVYPPIVFRSKPGNWGFGAGIIPVMNREIRELDDSLEVRIAYKTRDKTTLRFKITDGNNHDIRKQSRSLDPALEGDSIVYKLDPNLFSGLMYAFKVELEANGKTMKQISRIKVNKPGISRLVTDVDDALEQMVYILNSKEKAKLKKAKGDDRETLFKEFWKIRDPNPNTEDNELMDEYYRRIRYANQHFSGFTAGWMSDMGMIYVLFGPPDEVDRSSSSQYHRYYELWYYNRINRQFLFIDYNGFGDYRLDVPFMGNPFTGI